MSLHAKPSAEANELLRKAGRKSSVLSAIISLGMVVLILLLLGLFLLPDITKETPVIVAYKPIAREEEKPAPKRVNSTAQRKPTAPAATISRVIASASPSATSIPVPDFEVTEPSVEFGNNEDFGEGWSDTGFSEGGGGGGFGSGNAGSGGLMGYFYALEHAKNSTKAKPAVNRINDEQYWSTVAAMQSKRFSPASVRKYYRADKALYLTNLAIPNTPSGDGPALFGAKHIEGRFWIAHYSGTVTAPESGRFRFSGVGDNYLHAFVDGESVMHYGGAEPKNWGKGIDASGQFQSPYSSGWLVRNGKWFPLRAGQKIRLDIAIGESSGGMCGFLLQWEKEGKTYRKEANGRPILPLFTTSTFSDEEIAKLRSTFGGYEFDFEKTTVFPVTR